MTIEDTLVALAAEFDDVPGRIHAAVRNLRELRPGYPTTTPGNGSPGGGRGGGPTIDVAADGEPPDHVPVTSVELGVLNGTSIDDDDALRDLARLEAITRELKPRIGELRHIVIRWGYRTAGEYDDPRLTKIQRPRNTENATNAGRWCASHARLHGHGDEPIYRNELCRWCYDFASANKAEWPSLYLLDLRARGHRITQAIIDNDRRQRELAAERAEPKRHRKRTRLTGKRSPLAGPIPVGS